MLQADPRTLDLRRCRRAAQLQRQLIALRKAGRAERMAFDSRPPEGIGDDAAAIGVVASSMNFAASPPCRDRALIGDVASLWAKQSCSSTTSRYSGPMAGGPR